MPLPDECFSGRFPVLNSRVTDILIGTSAFTATYYHAPENGCHAAAERRIRTVIRFALNVEARCTMKSGGETKSGLFGTR